MFNKILVYLTVIATAFMYANIAIAVEDEALVVYFDFEEDSGDEVIDQSDKGNNGTIVGDAKKVDGYIGRGLELDGSNQHILIEYSDSMVLDDAVTFAGWFYFTNLEPNNNLIDTRIPEQWKEQGFNLWIQDAPDNNLVCPNADGWAHSADSKTGIEDTETWYHIAMVVDDTQGKVSVYLNGNLDVEANVDKGSLVKSEQPMIIGARADIQPGACMHGIIDEIAVWNVALTSQEIKEVYQNGVAPVFDGGCLPSRWGEIKNTN